MPTTQHGPFSVVNGPVSTGVKIKPTDRVRVVATGEIDFGGAFLGIGAPRLGPNGDEAYYSAPAGYPAPGLRKNSLICRVGSLYYQGGTDVQFTPSERGELVLQPNDDNVSDNSRGWSVTVYRTRARKAQAQV
jgi:hypothetical protein